MPTDDPSGVGAANTVPLPAEVVSLPTSTVEPWVTIEKVTGVGATATMLTQRFDVQLDLRRHGDWSVSWSMKATDAQVSLLPLLARVRVGVEVTTTAGNWSTTIGDFVIRKRTRKVVSTGEEDQQVWTYIAFHSGIDVARYRCRVYPCKGIREIVGGAFSELRVGQKPFGPDRHLGWMDPALDTSSWTAAFQLYQQGNYLGPPNGKWAAPFGWLSSDSWWIWSLANPGAGSHPEGEVFFHREFTTVSDQILLVDSAGDDEYELWLDGQLLVRRDQEKQGHTWGRLARTEVTVSPGTHTIRARVSNIGAVATNHGGLIVAVYEKVGGALVVETDSSWKCLGYPATVGMPVGQMLRLLVEDEPQARNSNGADPVGLIVGFTDTLDSDGNLWPVVRHMPVRVGSRVQEFVDQLAETYIEYEYVSGLGNLQTVLEAWVSEGSPLPGGGAGADRSTLYADGELRLGSGGNVDDLAYEESAIDLTNILLYLWGDGYAEYAPSDQVGPDPGNPVWDSVNEWGEHEGFLGIGTTEDGVSAFWQAVATSRPYWEPQPTVTANLVRVGEDGIADIPMVNYGFGHRVPVPSMEDPEGTTVEMRLVGCVIKEDRSSGKLSFTPTYWTSFEIWQERMDRWLRRTSNGNFDGKSEASSPDSPSIVKTELVEPTQQTFSGQDSTVNEVGTPYAAKETTLVVVNAVAVCETAGGGTSTYSITINQAVQPENVDLLAGSQRGFAQFNQNLLLLIGQDLNVKVTADGGHEKVSVDVFFAPWPFL